MNEIKLLADLIQWPIGRLEKVISLKDNYSLILKKKKDGSIRKIHAPNPELKAFQRKFLKWFLEKIFIISHARINGFKKGYSYITNAKIHADRDVRFVLRFDLQDAFPSVKAEYLRSVLWRIVRGDVEAIRSGQSFHPLFLMKRAKWFWILFKDLPQLSLFSPDPYKLLEKFVDLVISLTTYQGRLPQGAPTSPYLLNIVLCYSELTNKVYRFFASNDYFISKRYGFHLFNLSVYADDFTVSSPKPFSLELIQDLFALIERESFFRINRRKTMFFDKRRIAPLVTGLRLVEIEKGKDELKFFLSQQEHLTDVQRRSVLRKELKAKGKWIVQSVRLPKKEIRRIRGLIHRAKYQKELKPIIQGHLANLKAIYGDELPKQVMI